MKYLMYNPVRLIGCSCFCFSCSRFQFFSLVSFGANAELDLKLKGLEKQLIEKNTDLVKALHGGPGLVRDAVAQEGGVVPGGDAPNTDQGQEYQGHPETN